MALESKLLPEEQNLVEGFLNGVVFFDNFVPRIHKDVVLARDYQFPMLVDENVQAVTRAGRAVGKTVSLESDILRMMHNNPSEEGLLATPNEAHIEPLWNRMINFITGDEYWNEFAIRKTKSPYTIECKNGFILHGRISGTTKGTGLLGLHVSYRGLMNAYIKTQEYPRSEQGGKRTQYLK